MRLYPKYIALGVIICCMVSWCTSGKVKKQLIIGRNTGTLLLDSAHAARVFGFTTRLNEQPGLPGATIEATAGDSVQIDFWNVSQGDPHDIKIIGIEVQKENQRLSADADKAIRHMEHGYYSFVARRPGTYIYYSPVNYPFDLQAGMFGLLIISPRPDGLTVVHPAHTLQWCGYEIDTTWHTDVAMDTERGENDKLEPPLPYHPQYFRINAVALKAAKGETTLIHIANAGAIDQIISFPVELHIQALTRNAAAPSATGNPNTITLKPLETCELLVQCSTTFKGSIVYIFKDVRGSSASIQNIPVLITDN